ncbi:uroporphyrinogen-III synthase [Alphaproteobacteria bacterium GH1-50]|uniref:Uroporphyrinogen-III synthase n=1 Tax=Kangsaoukella pontilimi TaxID=2691042 RepID=A0A7C9MX89_9RHOB|nr:uroporphyrinogen-III synthase [Kangsaoukella pontilimi]MXQ08214.1 uroporphyrinogen-III synthase [Kangsaoukella pontilimi]
MDDEGATILMTRPADRSAAFLSLCETRAGRRLPAVVSPIIEIRDEGDLPDLARYRTIILTSASAVERLAREGQLVGRAVAAVGDRTAAEARAAGADAVALGDTVEDFLQNTSWVAPPAIHCRGIHARGDLAARLSEQGISCDEAVIYDQIGRPLSAAARGLLTGSGRVVLPVFSPRSARLIAEFGGITAPLSVVAMSDAVAEAWNGPGTVQIAREPTADAMSEAVLASL